MRRGSFLLARRLVVVVVVVVVLLFLYPRQLVIIVCRCWKAYMFRLGFTLGDDECAIDVRPVDIKAHHLAIIYPNWHVVVVHPLEAWVPTPPPAYEDLIRPYCQTRSPFSANQPILRVAWVCVLSCCNGRGCLAEDNVEGSETSSSNGIESSAGVVVV